MARQFGILCEMIQRVTRHHINLYYHNETHSHVHPCRSAHHFQKALSCHPASIVFHKYIYPNDSLKYTRNLTWPKTRGTELHNFDLFQYMYRASFIVLYCEPTNAHNNFTNYHTATCFDTIVSSSGSLQSIPCQVTPVFQMQLSVILFCKMNQQMHTTISQIITPLHVSTLSCHAQAACNQYLAKLHQYFKCSCL